MKKSTNLFKKRYIVVGIFALLLGCISLGYATLRETLAIQGDVTITKEKFQVSFENIKITEGSVATTNGATIDESDKNLVTFSNVTLSNSGDFYEFTVDIANTGNVDAKVSSIVASDTSIFTSESQSTLPSVDEVIVAGDRKTLKFRVEYDDTAPTTEPQVINFSYKINYVKE